MAEPRRNPVLATEHILLSGRRVEYRVVPARASGALRLRVGPGGVQVLKPPNRTSDDVTAFLDCHADWIVNQLQRVDPLRNVKRQPMHSNTLLFRGRPTPIRILWSATHARGTAISYDGVEIVVRPGAGSRTPVQASLERWLRHQARSAILAELRTVSSRIGVAPNRVYVMSQRTKWGNCSQRQNLSFNWRLVLAPEFVLQYLVTHEAVHLAIPDHSAKFWLTVQSLCPQTERARQWLNSRADTLRELPTIA